jgi:hypothetical protein
MDRDTEITDLQADLADALRAAMRTLHRNKRLQARFWREFHDARINRLK